MSKRITFIKFSKIFPKAKSTKIKSKEEAISLARKVAAALQKDH